MEGKRASAVTGDARAEAEFVVDVPNHPRLQVCKIASANNALPGETIDFTIRFDNVGDQKIGNVTIVDSLTTRLEYVAGSEKSSMKATFTTSARMKPKQSLVVEVGSDRSGAGQWRRRGPFPMPRAIVRQQRANRKRAALRCLRVNLACGFARLPPCPPDNLTIVAPVTDKP